MKRKLLASAILMAVLFTGVACGKEKVETKESKELVVATPGTLFPASYHNDKNELTGYDVDIINEMAKRMGKEVKYKELNVDGMLASVQNETVDFAASDFTLNEKRADSFALSVPLKYSFGSMIVRKSDNSGIEKIEDLKGKKSAGEAVTNYMQIAEQYGAELVSYDNATNDQYLTDVANGRTDVILNDYYLQKMSINAMPDIPVKILEGVYFNAEHSGFLFKKSNKKTLEEVNKVLEEMKKDGTIASISNTYFGTDVSVEPDVKVDTEIKLEDK